MNIIKHLHLVNKHRFFVFIHCIRLGLPFRGLKHDLSKYSPFELFNSAKYYRGSGTPIYVQRRKEGVYSSLAVRHTHRNKHHYEYWIDIYLNNVVLIMMPYKYAIEYVADIISASKVYNHKKYYRSLPYEYFASHSSYSPMHKGTREFVLTILSEYAKHGFKYLKKKHSKKIYQEIKNKYPKVEIHPIDLSDDIKIDLS